jgi:hypothetical protein
MTIGKEAAPSISNSYGTSDFTIESIDRNFLTREDYVRATDLHSYLVEWALKPGNLPVNISVTFLYACSREDIGGALKLLLGEFSDIDSTIPPSEPDIWTEWAAYWQRGFRPDMHY